MQAMSIHIGLNAVDPREYAGWHGQLLACEADARAMAALAEAQGITKRVLLLTADATYARVMAELKSAAQILRGGDYLLLTFAGHGASYDDIPTQPSQPGTVPATPGGASSSNAGDEDDGRDEAWCLYDTYLLDDELNDYFCKLVPGVRVCVVSDSCFSGTVIRDGRPGKPGSTVVRSKDPSTGRKRRIDFDLADGLYRRHFLTKYLSRRAAAISSRGKEPSAHIVLLAACQDDQTASEGDEHGLFTEGLLATWAGGTYQGSHPQFIELIKANMDRQKPNLFVTGKPNPSFLNARPFTPVPIPG